MSSASQRGGGAPRDPRPARRRNRRRKKLGVSSWSLPLGPAIRSGEVHGYYIDLRAKATSSGWPPPGRRPPEERLPIAVIQWGLGCYERYLAGDGEEWLAAALTAAGHLLEAQRRGGREDGAWVSLRPYPHTYRVEPPWVSAIAQGEAASLLVRLHRETSEERFAEAARRALVPMTRLTSEGGAQAPLAGRPFPQEFPTDPPSHVLNGAIFALWGFHDVGAGLGDRDAAAAFDAATDLLAANLHRWDSGRWSRYDLYPHRLPNLSSPGYHRLHINQLKAMHMLAPRPELEATTARFEAYARSPLDRGRAFAGKVAFRIAEPRNAAWAERLPWSSRTVGTDAAPRGR